MELVKKRPRIFYGWWIVLCGFLTLVGSIGIGLFGFTIFFEPMAEEFGGSRAAMAGVISVIFLPSFISPLIGRWIDKYGPRMVLIVGIASMGGCVFFMGLVTTLWQLYVLRFIMGMGKMCTALLGVGAAVSNWFDKKRGLANGLALSGQNTGGLFMAPLAGFLIMKFGWRPSLQIFGLIILLAVLLPIALLMKNRPSDLGLLPDGSLPNPGEKKVEPAIINLPDSPSSPHIWTLSTALPTPAFWMMFFGFSLFYMGELGILAHQTIYIIDIGITPELAATALGLTAGLGILGSVSFGFLGDRFNCRYVLLGGYLLQVISIFIFLNTHSLTPLFFYVIMFGIVTGGADALVPSAVIKNFGITSFGSIFGVIYVAINAGAFLGPIVVGYLFDIYQDYYWAFLAVIAMEILGAGLIFSARPPLHRGEL